MTQRLGHAPDRLALGIGFFAIGKSREQRDGKNGLLSRKIHGQAVACVGLNGEREDMDPR